RVPRGLSSGFVRARTTSRASGSGAILWGETEKEKGTAAASDRLRCLSPRTAPRPGVPSVDDVAPSKPRHQRWGVPLVVAYRQALRSPLHLPSIASVVPKNSKSIT